MIQPELYRLCECYPTIFFLVLSSFLSGRIDLSMKPLQSQYLENVAIQQSRTLSAESALPVLMRRFSPEYMNKLFQ